MPLPAIDKIDVKAIALGILLVLLLETYYIITTPGTTFYVFIIDSFLSIVVLLIVASFYISERKRMEKRLLKSERFAAIGEAATMVAHDLRNPLQSIEYATYVLKNELTHLSPSAPIPKNAMKMFTIIGDSVEYADKIVSDLRDFASTRKPMLKKTSINAVVRDVLSLVKVPQNVQLFTELGHLPEIDVDRDMMKRVFLNLAVNGIQAMENGGTLKVSTEKTRGFVEVSFKDTGIGIPKENLERIFSPFFTTKAQGMGMGLPVCKKLVDAHGGSIEIESREGKETTFKVKLPA